MKLTSQVLITGNIVETVLELEKLRTSENIIEVLSPKTIENINNKTQDEVRDYFIQRVERETETFKISDARYVIEKAYLASENKTIIVLGATSFSPDVQNKLLKILEEPPKNKEFIILAESKSSILPTIKSRLPVSILKYEIIEEPLGLDLNNLTLKSVYDFIKVHKFTSSKDMKRVLERISTEAIRSGKYNLDDTTLKLFSDAYLALDVASPGPFILSTILLKLLAKKI